MILNDNIDIIKTPPARFTLMDAIAAVIAALLACALLFGCAGAAVITPSVALQAVNSGLVAVDIAADQRIEAYLAGRRSRLKACREAQLATAEEREKCMGPYKESIADAVEESAQAFDLAVVAMDALGGALAEIDRAIAAAEETYGNEK